jgi:type I restriction enzyme M protein
MTNASIPTIDDILRGSAHALTIFSEEAIKDIAVFLKRGQPYLKCLATGKDRPAKPEEIVRQLYIDKLIRLDGYPKERLAVEKPVHFGSAVHEKAADIVVWDKDSPTTAYIIVECKKPKRSDGVEQLKSYCNAEGSPIGVWTNGGEEVILHRDEPNIFNKLTGLPKAHQTLADLLFEKWTLETLTRENKLITERTTLKEIILDIENLVLANAGVDAFEEVFKLIYAKLYDEWSAAQGGGKRYLQFRVGGASPKEFFEKIDDLFQKAKRKWPGVFLESERIDLTPEHLVTCGSFLQDVKLFNSNLQVIDEAFEYLSIEVGKGKKGQYFTPRHVIDMAVKMLNPSLEEYVIDTAAGSCGFTVHAIFHVWGNQFNATGPQPWQAEYAREKVYAIDFDARAIKIAKALNLIAGDGRSNVYRANSLDPRNWSDSTRVGLRNRLRRFLDRTDSWNQENYRFFDFDVLMTNPPFAGDIQDSRILHQFDLARKPDGKWKSSVGRDELFIERNLDFVKPGGRLAVVLPQGRLNNSGDRPVREFIMQQARILGVVGLHGNTFKPHAGTKTSVLLLQKWNNEPNDGPLCPKVDEYPIFFATSMSSGKDNSGEYVYLEDHKGERLYDLYGHPIVKHDLFNLRDQLAAQLKQRLAVSGADSEKAQIVAMYKRLLPLIPEDPGIAEAFRDWGKSLNFRFCGFGAT